MKNMGYCVLLGFLALVVQGCESGTTQFSSVAATDSVGVLAAVESNDSGISDDDLTSPPPLPGDDSVPPEGEAPGEDDAGSEPGNSTGNFVCILAGPGKSLKLGILSGAPKGQHKVPSVLCMSETACLEIASQAFEVKGPEQRGYCKSPQGNPHVHHVTDAQLQALVDAL